MIATKNNKSRKYAFGLLIMVIATVCWSYYGRVDIVTVAPGVVIPSSKIKKIQHLEGGIIKSINVHEGDRVRKGNPLVELEVIASSANLNEIEVRLTRLKIDLARLNAEFNGDKKLNITGDFRKVHTDLIRSANEFLNTRRRHITNLLNAQGLRVIQIEQGEKEIKERVKKNKEFLKVINEKMEISNELLKEDLTNRLEHLNLIQQKMSIEGNIKEDFWALKKLNSEREEAKIRKENIRDNYFSEIRSKIDEKESVFRELIQRKNKVKDSFKRSTIRAPVDGKIKVLYQTTTGGIIKPGETILDLVPNDDRLLVEARLGVDKVVYVSLGQDVNVQLIAQGNAGSSIIPGKVIYISADSITTNAETPFYVIKIKLEKSYFEEGGNVYQLLPGIQVMCNILTGSRSVMRYLVDPFYDVLDRALRER